MELKFKKYYVVEMLRYGNRENHSYVLGVFSDETSAQQAGNAEAAWRWDKYSPAISECVLDADMNMDNVFPFNWWTEKGNPPSM